MDSANPEVVEPLKFGVGDAGVNHGDAARGSAKLGHRVKGARIVRPLSGGVDNDGMGCADPPLMPARASTLASGGFIMALGAAGSGCRKCSRGRSSAPSASAVHSGRPGHVFHLPCRSLDLAFHDRRTG
jgi:hypothetical protein